MIAYALPSGTQEIGIRMALGAQRRDVLGMVVGQAVTLALPGSPIGAGGGVLTRFMSGLLSGRSHRCGDVRLVRRCGRAGGTCLIAAFVQVAAPRGGRCGRTLPGSRPRSEAGPITRGAPGQGRSFVLLILFTASSRRGVCRGQRPTRPAAAPGRGRQPLSGQILPVFEDRARSTATSPFRRSA